MWLSLLCHLAARQLRNTATHESLPVYRCLTGKAASGNSRFQVPTLGYPRVPGQVSPRWSTPAWIHRLGGLCVLAMGIDGTGASSKTIIAAVHVALLCSEEADGTQRRSPKSVGPTKAKTGSRCRLRTLAATEEKKEGQRIDSFSTPIQQSQHLRAQSRAGC